MNTSNISITLQPDQLMDDDRGQKWVTLEQVDIPDVANNANFYDVYQMLTQAQSGLSAWAYMKDICPMSVKDGLVKVWIDFYSFPSSMDLNYSLRPSLGNLGEPIRTEVPKEFDLVIDNTQTVDLPYAMESEPMIEWLSSAFNDKWQQIQRPEITVEDSRLILSGPCWGVVRVKCQAIGYLHTVVMELVKEEDIEQEDGEIETESYAIENLKCSIFANWLDGDGENQHTSLDLKIPKCVEDYLAECPGGTIKIDIIGDDGKSKTKVYYSTCFSRIIQVGTNE